MQSRELTPSTADPRAGGVLHTQLGGVNAKVLMTAACRVAGRSLSPAEWNTYFPGDAYVDACRPH